MDLVNRWLAYDDADCTLELDEYRSELGEQMLLTHLRVHQWSPASLKRIRHAWKVFRSIVTAPLFANPMQDDPKWVKFVTLMGWRPFTTVLCADGASRPLYIHTVHQETNGLDHPNRPDADVLDPLGSSGFCAQ